MTTIERPRVTPTTGGHELLDVDPTTLLSDVNVRHDARLDDAFCASVAELGVLVPIVAVRTNEGALRVRYGHRRTLAAVQVGRVVNPAAPSSMRWLASRAPRWSTIAMSWWSSAQSMPQNAVGSAAPSGWAGGSY